MSPAFFQDNGKIKYFEMLPENCSLKQNYRIFLEENINYYLEIAREKPFEGENLDSIPVYLDEQRKRLQELFETKSQAVKKD